MYIITRLDKIDTQYLATPTQPFKWSWEESEAYQFEDWLSTYELCFRFVQEIGLLNLKMERTE